MGCVWVVDDDEEFREVTVEFLELVGHRVVGLASLAEVRSASAPLPNVAIVDWNLPDADGDSVITALAERAPGCRVLLSTGDVDRTSSEPTVAGVVVKPYRLQDLAARIAALL